MLIVGNTSEGSFPTSGYRSSQVRPMRLTQPPRFLPVQLELKSNPQPPYFPL